MATSAVRSRPWIPYLIFAGWLGGVAQGAPPAAERTDAGAWTSETAFPLAGVVRAWGIFFPANGKFYVLGGRQSDAAGSEILHPREYYPLGQTWAAKFTAFPDNQVSNMVGGVLKVNGTDYIVLVGGAAAGATTASSAVLVFDPVADTGTALAADPWPGNAGGVVLPGGAAVYANKLYVFGGLHLGVGMVDTIWSFDPLAAAGSRWTEMSATLPTPLGYIPTATSGRYIYLLGGSEYVDGSPSDSTHAYRYDPQLDVIAPITAVPRPTGETRAVTQRDGRIWLLGGGRNAPNPATQVDVYDPVTNSWSLGPPMLTARRNFAADVNPATGEVFAVGGYAPTTAINTTERWSALIFNNGFELGALCFWNNTADVYYFATNSGAVLVPGTTDTGNHTDDGSTVIALPFPYQLYDTFFDSVAVGSNGHLTFGIVSDSASPSCIPVSGPTYVIAPYWTDQCTTSCWFTTCSGCGIFTSTSGTAPHRIFNIEYRTVYRDSGSAGVPLNYEVRLFEGQMGFELIYGAINPFTPSSPRNLSVGVQLDSGPSNYSLYGCDPTGGSAPPIPPAGKSLIWAACGTP
jgi:hypothetical protein